MSSSLASASFAAGSARQPSLSRTRVARERWMDLCASDRTERCTSLSGARTTARERSCDSSPTGASPPTTPPRRLCIGPSMRCPPASTGNRPILHCGRSRPAARSIGSRYGAGHGPTSAPRQRSAEVPPTRCDFPKVHRPPDSRSSMLRRASSTATRSFPRSASLIFSASTGAASRHPPASPVRLLQGRFGAIGGVATTSSGDIYFFTQNNETWSAGRDVLVRLRVME